MITTTVPSTLATPEPEAPAADVTINSEELADTVISP